MPRKHTPDATAAPMDFAHRVELLAANQIFRVEQQIERRLEELCGYERKLTMLEGELDEFIDNYYAEVGDLCEALTQVESQLAQYQTFAVDSSHQSLKAEQAAWKKSDQKAKSKARKGLYRRLVKDCHPDINADNKLKKQQFMRVQSAYETNSMAALWQVEWEGLQKRLRTLDTSERLQQMLRWFNEMEGYGMELTDRYRARRESPAAQLLERYVDARLAGRDFMGSVKQQLETQVQQVKQTLVSTKIRTLYLEAK